MIYILYSLTHHFYEFQEKEPLPPLTMRQKIMIYAKFVNNNNVYIEITIHLFASVCISSNLYKIIMLCFIFINIFSIYFKCIEILFQKSKIWPKMLTHHSNGNHGNVTSWVKQKNCWLHWTPTPNVGLMQIWCKYLDIWQSYITL